MNVPTKLAAAAIVGYTALQVARQNVRRNRHFDWHRTRVIVTCGSRGLGLVIARQLVDQGARLAICARNESELEQILYACQQKAEVKC